MILDANLNQSNVSTFGPFCNQYYADTMAFLSTQREELACTDLYFELQPLYYLPLSIETILTVESLVLGGAEVTPSELKELPQVPIARKILTDAGIDLSLEHQFIFWKDIDSIYLGCNENFAALVGLHSIESVIGKTDEDLNWGAGEADYFKQQDHKVMHEGYIYLNREERLQQTDGSVIIMLVSKIPLKDPNGKCIGLLGTSTDITARKQLENQLKQAQKTQFYTAANMAHEIRNPLLSIFYDTQGIEKYLPKLLEGYQQAKTEGLIDESIPSKHLKSLNSAIIRTKAEINYANSLIDTLLMTAGNKVIDTSTFTRLSINHCIQQALKRYAFSNKEKDILHWDHQLDFDFYGPELLTVHVFFNLIKNALKYTANKEGASINISTKTPAAEACNYVKFKDTGAGISPEVMPRLFEAFFTTSATGMGVGLSFSKMVMESLGGAIECISEEGAFTEFTLSFPKVAKDAGIS